MDKIEEILMEYGNNRVDLVLGTRVKQEGILFRADAAKQIRQQIGRELLELKDWTGIQNSVYAVSEKNIREVCMLEEE